MTEDGLSIHGIYGFCPVQADGTVDGTPFYFRARGRSWRIGIGGDVVSNPDWGHAGQYGDGPFDAGCMDHAEAETFIRESVSMFRGGLNGNFNLPPHPDEGTTT